MSVLKFFKRKSKTVNLTNQDKVALAKGRISEAFSMFQDINNELNEVNSELEAVIKEETELVAEIEKNREKALDELQMNKGLQEKLKQFIV